ncbi:glycerophosphodiester phosphodiesterase 1 isoform 2-T2 [Macrochelys suwanniensis]
MLGPFTALLGALLVLSRSPVLSCLLTGGLYLALQLFSLEPVSLQRARHIVQPRGAAARIAHRGGAHDAPENTLAAIRQAAENGATGVELDLEFTADGIPILMHDDTVERTTDGSGRLRDFTFEEIRKLNPSAKHRLWRDFRGEKVPTLKEAVMECMHYNLIIYFDVKGHANQAVDVLKLLYLEYPRLYNSSIVCSFTPEVVYKVHGSLAQLSILLPFSPYRIIGIPEFVSLVLSSSFESLLFHLFLLSLLFPLLSPLSSFHPPVLFSQLLPLPNPL